MGGSTVAMGLLDVDSTLVVLRLLTAAHRSTKRANIYFA
jgi:hypothetical protein